MQFHAGHRPVSGHVFRVDRGAGRSGTRSTGCPTAARSRRRSARPGPSAAARRPATSPSAPPRPGCATSWTRRARGTLPGMVRTGVTFADAAAEWLRYVEHDRGCKPSTLRDYRSIVRAHLLPAFGDAADRGRHAARDRALASRQLDRPRRGRKQQAADDAQRRSSSARASVYGLPAQPGRRRREAARSRCERRHRRLLARGGLALVRAADAEQDAAIYLTAAFTGLRRGELLALRWRDVDFAGSAIRVRASYAGGAADDAEVAARSASVPMAPEVAAALARLGQREHWTRRRRPGLRRRARRLPRRLGAAPALQGARCERAGLRPLRFHDLRHTFGTRMIAKADIRRVQEWMGHADVADDDAYLHYVPRPRGRARWSPRRSRSTRRRRPRGWRARAPVRCPGAARRTAARRVPPRSHSTRRRRAGSAAARARGRERDRRRRRRASARRALRRSG